jgi:hypothetical protein
MPPEYAFAPKYHQANVLGLKKRHYVIRDVARLTFQGLTRPGYT